MFKENDKKKKNGPKLGFESRCGHNIIMHYFYELLIYFLKMVLHQAKFIC